MTTSSQEGKSATEHLAAYADRVFADDHDYINSDWVSAGDSCCEIDFGSSRTYDGLVLSKGAGGHIKQFQIAYAEDPSNWLFVTNSEGDVVDFDGLDCEDSVDVFFDTPIPLRMTQQNDPISARTPVMT